MDRFPDLPTVKHSAEEKSILRHYMKKAKGCGIPLRSRSEMFELWKLRQIEVGVKI